VGRAASECHWNGISAGDDQHQTEDDSTCTQALSIHSLRWIGGFLYMGCTLAPPGEYDWTVRVLRRCGLMSNYFDHLFIYVFSALKSNTVKCTWTATGRFLRPTV